jgi:tRNA U34 5-methylaminomethyl-2-thiouridine-forming methyltransferase MnmC
MNKIVLTGDGSHTIYIPELDEHYHSVNGAVQESEFIFIKEGFDYCRQDPVNIFEVGFGTGLNALLTALRAGEEDRNVFYTAVEKYPLDRNIISSLNYPEFTHRDSSKLFELIHSSEWGSKVSITRNFNLMKIKGDLQTDPFGGPYNLIYFDAFGPDKQPGMWTRDIFSKISLATLKNGVFVTYSAKGDVRRNLIDAGFSVTLLPGPPGKRQIIRAIKT